MKPYAEAFAFLFLVVSQVSAQVPPPLTGFHLGDLRGARHRAMACSQISAGSDYCEASDTNFLEFLGDTLVAITYHKDLGITPRTASQLWREYLLLRTTQIFGPPDSVRNQDSAATTESGMPAQMRTTTAYWTGRPGRGWTATAFILKVAPPDGIGLASAVIMLQCGWRAGEAVAKCPRRRT